MLKGGPANEVSIITPAHNEVESIGPLVQEVCQVMEATTLRWELIVVDDGSTDGTADLVAELIDQHPGVRSVSLSRRQGGAGHGQSIAFRVGFMAAKFDTIATLDADGQNDPADIPRFVELMREHAVDMVQGDRSAGRRDSVTRRFASWFSRQTRHLLLGDTTRDTACSLRVMSRCVALALPLHLRGQHRFIPYGSRRMGFSVIEQQVNHRSRKAGQSKYGLWDRALPGLIDCIAVRWLYNRWTNVPRHQETNIAKPQDRQSETAA